MSGNGGCRFLPSIHEFRGVFGETPYRYLQRRRVEWAMFMLRHGTDSVTEVCANVGFTSLGTFSRTFTAIVGAPPTAYWEASAATEQPAPTSFAMRWSRRAGYSGSRTRPQRVRARSSAVPHRGVPLP